MTKIRWNVIIKITKDKNLTQIEEIYSGGQKAKIVVRMFEFSNFIKKPNLKKEVRTNKNLI